MPLPNIPPHTSSDLIERLARDLLSLRETLLEIHGMRPRGVSAHMPFGPELYHDLTSLLDARSSHPQSSSVAPANHPVVLVGATAKNDLWELGTQPKRAEDFTWIYWPGLGKRYFAGKKQQAVAATMWALWLENDLPVSDAELLRAADSDGGRLRDLFRNHPAWGTLIIQGDKEGTRTFPPVPDHWDSLDT